MIKIFKPHSGVSSKRVLGAIILIIELLSININSFTCDDYSINITNLHNTLIIVGASLLGVGVLEGITAKNKKDE